MSRMRQLVRTLVACMSMQGLACVEGDVILGERGRELTDPLPDVTGLPPTVLDAAAVSAPTRSDAAADSGSDTLGGSAVAVSPPTDSGRAEDASTGFAKDAAVPPARPSAGCGKTVTMTMTMTMTTALQTITVSGQPASFLLDLPTAYDPAHGHALLLAFRGMDRSAEQFRSELALAATFGSDGIIAYTNPVNSGEFWEFTRDMPLVDAIIDSLGDTLCLDLDRVYALGHADGAMFVNLVGCVRTERVRAVALLSASPPPLGPCTGNTAAWLMQRADADPATIGSGLGNRDFWLSRNGCDAFMTKPAVASACVAFASCDTGQPIHYCEYQGEVVPAFAPAAIRSFFQAL